MAPMVMLGQELESGEGKTRDFNDGEVIDEPIETKPDSPEVM